MILIRIGLMNILKNLRRDSLTLLMISFGMCALFIYSGSNADMFRQFKGLVIKKQYGYFQLHAAGYIENEKSRPFDFLIRHSEVVAGKLQRLEAVRSVAPRLSFTGMLAGDDRIIVVRGFGGRPEAEKDMEYGSLGSGVSLSDAGAPSASLGELAFGKLSGKLGESLTILTSQKGGSISGLDLKITGTRKASGENDIENQFFILARLEDAQEFLGEGDSCDTIIVQLRDGFSPAKAEKAIAELCLANNLEYRRWDQLAVFYESAKLIYAANQDVLTFIILMISVFIIINTLYMSFMERIREVGSIRAIGTSKDQVAIMFLVEGGVLAASGGALGIAIAGIISAVIDLCGGIYHPASVFNAMEFHTRILPEWSTILSYWLLFIGVALVASIAISIRALRLSIAASLRYQ